MSSPSTGGTTPDGLTGGSIYDLGYRHYAGRRLGRQGAFLALYVDGFRASFALGRPARAKIVPVGLTVLALLPAVIAVAVEAIAGRFVPSPIRYENYFSTIVTFLVLFVAAQAPELLGRDQRHGVLALYFSRALHRLDYPAAKLLALTTALLIVSILPQAGIFLGKVLGAVDPVEAFLDNLPSVPPIVLSAMLAALVMAALGLAVAAFTPRRAYATAGIFALFVISSGVSAVLSEVLRRTRGISWEDLAPLLAPTAILEGATAWLFGSRPGGSLVGSSSLPGPVYLAAALVLVAVATGLLGWRYRRIPV